MKAKLLLSFGIILLACQAVFGGFIGSTILIEPQYPAIGEVVFNNSFEVLVADGIELIDIRGYEFDIDILNSSITFTGFEGAVSENGTQFDNTTLPGYDEIFNGFYFFDLGGTLPAFSSVTINPATNMAGLDQSRILYDENNIYINFAGLYAFPNTYVQMDVGFAPEPATVLLFGIGAMLLRGRRRVCVLYDGP